MKRKVFLVCSLLSLTFGAQAQDALQTKLIRSCFSQTRYRLASGSAFVPSGSDLTWEAKTRKCLFRRQYNGPGLMAGGLKYGTHFFIDQASASVAVPANHSCRSQSRADIQHPVLGRFIACAQAISSSQGKLISATVLPQAGNRAPHLELNFVGSPQDLVTLVKLLEPEP